MNFFTGLLEELFDVLKSTEDPQLMVIQAAALRLLAAIVHMAPESNFPKPSTIKLEIGATYYHGRLPILARSCITSLKQPVLKQDPARVQQYRALLILTEAIFSLLYHFARCESDAEEPIADSRLMRMLLGFISWPGSSSNIEYISLATQAVHTIEQMLKVDFGDFKVR